ncbi:hypothetical protein AQUCO_00400624v1 [Aquilegia coerulea]|uniref:Coenzyme Q-binding protein COQ10 START domain-containing protein n=1 Tax=Aquilegia coerulea TaxID=218851 RepID=A0A2G5EW40_AQUCA|nr:hypothetical protein AQUCO_00400624v1 [Aquilegia coerulea]
MRRRSVLLGQKLLMNSCGGGCNQIQCLSSSRISGFQTQCLSNNNLIGSEKKDSRFLFGKLVQQQNVQVRNFIGCGDGEEGNVLSKNYEERRVLGYSPEQLFAVVAAVDLYQDFVPWCQRSKIVQSNTDGSFEAELEIGFKFFVESYVSHVELSKPKCIKTTVSQCGLFEHLINVWEFNPGPAPGTCNVHFLVDFKFHSPLYGQAASTFFKDVVSRLISSFSDRCRLIYGPGIKVR